MIQLISGIFIILMKYLYYDDDDNERSKGLGMHRACEVQHQLVNSFPAKRKSVCTSVNTSRGYQPVCVPQSSVMNLVEISYCHDGAHMHDPARSM